LDVGLARAAQVGPAGRAQRLDGKARAPLHQQLELLRLGMAAAYLPARERLRDHQPVKIERVQVVATVLDGRGGGEPERRARRDDLCPRTRKPRYRATRAAHR